MNIWRRLLVIAAMGLVAGWGWVPAAVATSCSGGTETMDGSYKVHTFTGSATLTINTPGNVDVLVVGGGGGGGGYVGGGGGGGGVVYQTGFAISGSSIAVTVGTGGTGGAGDAGYTRFGGAGNLSLFSTLTAGGGGGGGAAYVNNNGSVAAGSGGGAGSSLGGAVELGQSGTQGTSGGNSSSTQNGGCGGGGGASTAGSSGLNAIPIAGVGGDGLPCSITGSSLPYGGGGGGGTFFGSTGGGGGAGGGGPHGSAGTDGRGGGGGGGGWNSSATAGGKGGSGVVIVRYLLDLTPPDDVSALSAASGHKSVKLNWANPASTDFTGVLVVRKAGSAPTFTPAAGATYTQGQDLGGGQTAAYVGVGTSGTPGTSSEWLNTGLDNGTTYYFKVCAYDVSRNYAAGASANATSASDTTAPADVGSLTATASRRQIVLNWTNPSDTDYEGVLIVRKTGSAPTFVPSAETTYTQGQDLGGGQTVAYAGKASDGAPGNAAAWTDTGLSAGTMYAYKGYAYDEAPNYAAGQAASATAPLEVNFPAAWSYRKKITIDRTKVAGDLTNFPVLVSLTADADLTAHAQANGNDICFTTADGATRLSHEIESYSAGTLVAWVKMPSLSNATDTVLYMLYGNPAAANQEDVTAMWSGEKAVWHMGEADGRAQDATGNGHNASTVNALPSSTTGKIGLANDFVDAQGDYITVPVSSDFDASGTFTISAWVYSRSDGASDYEAIVGTHATGWILTLYGTSPANALQYYTSGAGWANSGVNVTEGAWSYVAMVYENGVPTATTDGKLYINGVQAGASFNGLDQTAGANLTIGAGGAGWTSYPFEGIIDELHIARAARSAAWLLTSYNNQGSPSTFMTLGAEQANSVFSASGSEATANVSVNAVLTQSPATPVQVDYAVTGGTASRGVDYTLPDGTLTYGAGVMTQSIAFTVSEDFASEGNETLEVTLTNPYNAALGTVTQFVYTIQDNDTSLVGGIFVDWNSPGPTRDGTSWNNAYTTVSAALTAATSGKSIWVAKGTYADSATLQMRTSVDLYGGFTSGMLSFEQRDWNANQTLLSGGGARAVINGANTAILDGFVITNGAAANGGGMYNNAVAPTVRNCTFANNAATAGVGGGVYNNGDAADATFTNCVFRGNTATSHGAAMDNADADPVIRQSQFTFNRSSGGSGGAIYDSGTVALTLTDCTFTSNRAAANGGALYSPNANVLTVSNCVFTANQADANAGAIYADNNKLVLRGSRFVGNAANYAGALYNNTASKGFIEDCVFIGNQATNGVGGAYYGGYNGGGALTNRNCTFVGNTATSATPTDTAGGGGALGCAAENAFYEACVFSANRAAGGGGAVGRSGDGTASWIFKRCVFVGNESGYGGGILYGYSSGEPRFENSLLAGNVSAGNGGGVCLNSGTGPGIRALHCTFSGNRAATSGGALYQGVIASYATNCIFWGDSAGTSGNEIHQQTANKLVLGYSDVQGGWTGLGGNNINGDPVFTSAPGGSWEACVAYDASIGQTMLTDNDASWSANAYAGKTVNPDTGQYLQFVIASNTTHTLYAWGNARNNRAGGALADVGDSYQIKDYSIASDSSPVVGQALDLGFTSDVTGFTRPYPPGGASDMGAYEQNVSPFTVTLGTTPSGLTVNADSDAQIAPHSYSLLPGSHTISVSAMQTVSVGTRYAFQAWADGPVTTNRTIAVSAPASYMAGFSTQYLWQAVSHLDDGTAGGGTVDVADGWYAKDATFTATASALTGYQFVQWTNVLTGAVLGTDPSLNVTMDSYRSVAAVFTQQSGTHLIIIQSAPPGRTIVVDGVAGTGGTFSWDQDSVHTAAVVDAIQDIGGGTRYVYQSWAPSGNQTNVITVGASDATYTAQFKTQYVWTVTASPAADGGVTPASGSWYDLATVVPVSASANGGYGFKWWTGDLSGTTPNPSVTMNGPRTATALFAALAVTDVIYVDQSAQGANNGSWWGAAFTSLKSALDAATSGKSIWVAQGTYTDSATFQMNSGVNMYGGFQGIEGALGERNWASYGALLSGQAARTVINGANTAILDGFVITNGAAANGGGMYNNAVAPTVRNCTFANNAATAGVGGGVYNTGDAADATFTNCVFRGNTATSHGAGMYNGDADPTIRQSQFTSNRSSGGSGGAIFDSGAVVLTLTDCAFTSNGVASVGGAIYSPSANTLSISNCVFTANWADANAGAIYAYNNTLALRSSRFVGNVANSAGGIWNDTSSKGFIEDCVFIGNQATNGTGGAYYGNGGNGWMTNRNCTFAGNLASSPAPGALGGSGGALSNLGDNSLYEACVFSGNRAAGSGGVFGRGYYDGDPAMTLRRCTFAGNESGLNGGVYYGVGANTAGPLFENSVLAGNVAANGGAFGIPTESATGVRARHCTFSGNRATTSGGVLWGGVTYVYMTNSIFWGDSAGTSGNEIHEQTANRTIIGYSDVQGGWSGLGGNNLNSNPLFTGGPSGIWEACAVYDAAIGQTALTDNDANWTANAYAGKTVNPDTGQYLQFVIASNTAHTLYVWGNARNNRAGAAVADVGNTYQINDYSIASDSSPVVGQALDLGFTSDITGFTRPYPPGGASDMGAYERAISPFTVALDTTPSGLTVNADSDAQIAPHNYSLLPGSHTISVSAMQTVGVGTRYVFQAWADGPVTASRTIAVSAPASYMAGFSTQYLWQAVSHVDDGTAGGGTVDVADGWYNRNAGFTATASPLQGYQFVQWTNVVTGAVLGTDPSLAVTMDSYRSVAAVFQQQSGTHLITIQSAPAGRTIVVDGVAGTGGTFSWDQDSVHTAAIVDTIQDIGGGTRYVYQSWSPSGAQINVITVGAGDATYTAQFKTQYVWTVTSTPAAGGSVTPSSGTWYDFGTVVPVSASASGGYGFKWWTGDLSGTAANSSVTMNGPRTATALLGALAVTDVIYVDQAAQGANNGSWWGAAFTSLKSALDAATSGKSIWVAQGTYTDSATFQMKSGVNMYGGFQGIEGALGERNWASYGALLSGQAARTVINGANTAVLDGFVITNGASANGGGMYNNAVAPTVRNCTFANNAATAGVGGGMYNSGDAADAVFTNCVFRDNTATSHGAGMYNGDADPTLRDCQFTGNRSTGGSGGAIYDSGAVVLTLAECTFTSNRAAGVGGVIYSASANTLTITNGTFTANRSDANGGVLYAYNNTLVVRGSRFVGNVANSAGGIWNDTSSKGFIEDCVFIGNQATNGTGGAYYGNGGNGWMTNRNCTFAGNVASSPTPSGLSGSGGALSNLGDNSLYEECVFSGNRAAGSGGVFGRGYYDGDPAMTLRRCMFAGNESGVAGGVFYGIGSTHIGPLFENSVMAGNQAPNGGVFGIPTESATGVRARHCTFSGNRATTSGGVLWGGVTYVYMTNSIFWGDSAGTSGNEIYEQTANRTIIGYSDVQGGWAGLGGNNINSNPLFTGGPSGTWEACGAYDAAIGQTMLTDNDASWSANAYAGKAVNPGTGQYLQFVIASNTAHTLYVWGNARNNRAGAAVADVGDTYQIHDYRISLGSSCVNAGIDVSITNDFNGMVRPQGNLFDMGAYEATPPLTVAINQAAGQIDPSISPINFTVVFSEPASGFATGDITLDGTAGATTAIVTGGPTTYNVAVSGMTGDGTVIATIDAGRAHATSGMANDPSTSTDNTVTYDGTPPTVTINQAAGQADPINGGPINFTVVFSEAVSDFGTSDVTLVGTAGATTAVVTGGGTTYNVAVSGMTGSGTVIASIDAGRAHDAAGNPNDASTSTDNTVTYDVTPPTVTINQAGGQGDPTGSSPINFTVVFSEAVSDFATGDVTLGGLAGATTAVVTGGGTTYNVAVNGMTGGGTVIASIDAGRAHDGVGNASDASTSTDNTVTYALGTLTIDVTPDTGSWTISAYPGGYTGSLSGTGDLAPASAPAGTYTVHYGALSGYTAPADQTQTPILGGGAAFIGTYRWTGTQFLFQ